MFLKFKRKTDRGRQKRLAKVEHSPGATGPSSPDGTNTTTREDREAPSQSIVTQAVFYTVSIPDGIIPGERFEVWASDRVVPLRCPQDARLGQELRFRLDLPHDSPGVRRCCSADDGPSAGVCYEVVVPPGAPEHFTIAIGGQMLSVKRPPIGWRSRTVRIKAPSKPSEPPSGMTCAVKCDSFSRQAFQATVPKTAMPGDSLVLVASVAGWTVRMLVIVPEGACPGSNIRFSVPGITHLGANKVPPPPQDPRTLRKGSIPFSVLGGHGGAWLGGWVRVVRVSGSVLQWVPLEADGYGCDIRAGGTSAASGLAERVFRKESVRQWVSRDTSPTKDDRTLPSDECRYVLFLCLELCSRGRATANDPLLPDVVALPRDLQRQVISFACGLAQPAVSADDVFGNKRAFVCRVKQSTDPGQHHQSGGAAVHLVPAQEAMLDPRPLSASHGLACSVSAIDILAAQQLPFEGKVVWFREQCARQAIHRTKEPLRMTVRRNRVLEDSVKAVAHLTTEELRKAWRVEFMGDSPDQDAGISWAEWLSLLARESFGGALGLWEESDLQHQMRPRALWQIAPVPESHCADQLRLFRFLGLVMGKAILTGCPLPARFTLPLHKLLLGCPITFDDLMYTNFEYHTSLSRLQSLTAEEIERLWLDFTSTQPDGTCSDLIPGGADVKVTSDNLPEYLEACLRHQVFGRVHLQLSELLLGFFEVVPASLISVFEVEELDVLLSGAPKIDIEELKSSATYSGLFENGNHCVCVWFWEIVLGFDDQMLERLVHFVTNEGHHWLGPQGSHGGNSIKINIHGMPLDTCLYPRAHTDFHRIDLPVCSSKIELEEKLKLALHIHSTSSFSLD